MSPATDEPEVLEADAPASRTLRVVGLVVVAAVATGILAWAEGVRRAPEETAAIAACADDAIAAVDDAEARLAAMANYVGPVIGSSTKELDDVLRRKIAIQATTARRPVDEAFASCDSLAVWPLDGERRAARDAVVAFLAAEQQRLDTIEQEGRGYYTGYDRVRALREEAEALVP